MSARLRFILLLINGFLILFMPMGKALAKDRLVSTSGAISETLVLLGKADSLVGVDTTSNRPPNIMQTKEKIGYRRNLSAEGILSLNPSLILLAPDAGPDTVIEQIQNAGVKTITIEDDKTKASVIASIHTLAALVNTTDKGNAIVKNIEEKSVILEKTIQRYPSTPNVAFLLDIGNANLTALGKDSVGDKMLRIVNANNVFADDFKQFKSVSIESILSEDPDVILIAKRQVELVEGDVINNDEYTFLAPSRAAKNNCVYQVDITLSLGFGPSYIDGAQKIADHLNQCLQK